MLRVPPQWLEATWLAPLILPYRPNLLAPYSTFAVPSRPRMEKGGRGKTAFFSSKPRPRQGLTSKRCSASSRPRFLGAPAMLLEAAAVRRPPNRTSSISSSHRPRPRVTALAAGLCHQGVHVSHATGSAACKPRLLLGSAGDSVYICATASSSCLPSCATRSPVQPFTAARLHGNALGHLPLHLPPVIIK